MEGHLLRDWQELQPLDLEIRSPEASSSDIELGFLSPSFIQSSNNDNEPLIRKPVLPPRTSSKSLGKQLSETEELEQMSSNRPGPFWESLGGKPPNIAPPKTFKKTHRFLGLNLGYWRLPARHFSIFAILMLVTIIPLYYVVIGYSNLQTYDPLPFTYDCNAASDGWSFVGINLRFGTFNYGAAKALDLAWNWIVGRGLQGLLMLLAYRVFTDALLRAGEMAFLPYELYASLSLYSTTLKTLWHLMKAIAQRGNWRTKAIFTWLFISTIYLLAFPSLMDACSGYESSYLSFFQWPNGTLENTADFADFDWYNAAVTNNVFSITPVCVTWFLSPGNQSGIPYDFSYVFMSNLNSSSNSSAQQDCYDMMANSDLVSSEIYNLYYWQNHILNTSWWAHFQSDPLTSQSSYWAEWNFYPTDPQNFRCTTEANVYQWGFSYEWLFMVSIVNSAWLLGTWILWVDCDINSELCKKGRRLGLWRAVADISEAMREELGPNICAYSESELAEALKNRPPIKYYVDHGTSQKSGHIGLSSKASGRFRLRWDHEYGAHNKIIARPRHSSADHVSYSKE